MKKTNKILRSFIREFWYAPSDVFLRVTEALIWSRQKLESPVLDIGCGDGRISKLLLAGHRKIDVGIDIEPRAVEKARACGKYKKVIVADATKVPFREKSFYTVISNSTFEHIKNDIEAIREVSRVLKKGGLFLFTIPSRRLKNILEDIIKDKRKFNTFNKRVGHYHYRTLNDWERILKGVKLKIVYTEYYFPRYSVRIWYKLFRIATFNPYRRELWSYLKDSPYGKLAPQKLIKFLLTKYLSGFYKNMFTKNGCWLFIIAKKKE